LSRAPCSICRPAVSRPRKCPSACDSIALFLTHRSPYPRWSCFAPNQCDAGTVSGEWAVSAAVDSGSVAAAGRAPPGTRVSVHCCSGRCRHFSFRAVFRIVTGRYSSDGLLWVPRAPIPALGRANGSGRLAGRRLRRPSPPALPGPLAPPAACARGRSSDKVRFLFAVSAGRRRISGHRYPPLSIYNRRVRSGSRNAFRRRDCESAPLWRQGASKGLAQVIRIRRRHFRQLKQLGP